MSSSSYLRAAFVYCADGVWIEMQKAYYIMQKGSFTLYYNLKLCFLLLFLFTRLCSVYLFFYFTADIIVVVEKNSQQHNSIVCTLTLCIHFSISLVFIFFLYFEVYTCLSNHKLALQYNGNCNGVAWISSNDAMLLSLLTLAFLFVCVSAGNRRR